MSPWDYLIEAVRTHPFNFFTLLFALAAVTVSIYAWRAATRQAKASERQATAAESQVRLQAEALQSQGNALRAQASDTEKALEIANRSAKAAERLAEANEALAITGQRGWLIIEGASATAQYSQTEPKVIIRAHFRLRNVGKTPITNIMLRHCQCLLAEAPRGFVDPQLEQRPTLEPRGDIETYRIYECTQQEYARIKRRDLFAFFYGNAMYEDVFGCARGFEWRWYFDGNELRPSENGNSL